MMACVYSMNVAIPYGLVAVLDKSQDLLWCLAIVHLINFNQSNDKKTHPFIQLFVGAIGLSLVVNASFINSPWSSESFIVHSHIDALGHVIMSSLALVLIEYTFRTSSQSDQWAIKYLLFGLSGLFIYDFYMYSNALLAAKVDRFIWDTRGAITALIAPLMVISFRRNQRFSLDYALSRQVIFRSSLILVCAVYLIVIGGLGIILKSSNAVWGQTLQWTFSVGSGILLAALLCSSKAKAYLKVQLSKHLFKYYYDYREEWLRFSGLLGEEQTHLSIYKRIILALSGLTESLDGVLLERKDKGMVVLERLNPNDDFTVQSAFSKQLEQLNEPTLLEKMNTPDKGDFSHFWLAVPLVLENQCEFIVLLSKPSVNLDYNWEVIELLKAASSQAASFAHQAKVQDQLIIAKQFESYHQMSSFVLHDLKNIMSSVQLILKNERLKDNPDYINSVFTTLQGVNKKLTKVQDQLEQRRQGHLNEHFNAVEVLKELERHYGEKGEPIKLECQASQIWIEGDSLGFKHAFMHLIDNGIEASSQAQVEVRIIQNDCIRIEVIDYGVGMDQSFIDHELFKPFSSTKGTKGMGIGMYQVKTTIEQLRGQIDVTSTPGQGTCFSIKIENSSLSVQTKQEETAI